ncbi:hypothetical protein BU107_10675 [Staphylococcus xylosus]|uniref:hypothetical protein n=1 Tax=Staphylococcus xylosus TaxID=1288 RepID=UPI000E6A92BE|nr:hypothetical protein [Staphylococcus xylosus]RIM86014.1 hypothetical protein BU107_10675 [Staphylococcus xylosus]
MDNISKKSEFVLKQLYKVYLDKIEDGDTYFRAKYYGGCSKIQNDYFLGFTFDELRECINILSDKEYLIVSYASDSPISIILSNSAIEYMDKAYSRNVNSLLKDLNKLKTFLGL